MNSVERKSLQSGFAKETANWQPGQLAAAATDPAVPTDATSLRDQQG